MNNQDYLTPKGGDMVVIHSIVHSFIMYKSTTHVDPKFHPPDFGILVIDNHVIPCKDAPCTHHTDFKKDCAAITSGLLLPEREAISISCLK
jgi:hypothetical protein